MAVDSDIIRPSSEQQKILDAFNEGHNIAISSVAGSGKTTTLIWLAEQLKNSRKKCWILTYNKSLQVEVSDKIKHLRSYCNVSTFHAAGNKLYNKFVRSNKYNLSLEIPGFRGIIRTDLELFEMLKYDIDKTVLPDVLMVDEVQDMNSIYYRLVTKILRVDTQLVLVGDEKQCINTYAGAESKYLINYKEYFSTNRSWIQMHLYTSYRLTPLITNFVNDLILGETKIIAGNTKNYDRKPLYMFDVYNFVGLDIIISEMLERYGPNETIIICPSTKSLKISKHPVGLLMKLKKCIIWGEKDIHSSIQSTKNKLICTTFNSMKGLERKCVIVYGLDCSYFHYYERDWKKEDGIPNILYVAATRAKEMLVIIKDNRFPDLPGIDNKKLTHYCSFINERKIVKDIVPFNPSNSFTVKELIKHRHIESVINMINLLDIKVISTPSENFTTPSQIHFDNYIEDVPIFYGILIPIYSEIILNSKLFPTIISRHIENLKTIGCGATDSGIYKYFPTNNKDGYIYNKLNDLLNKIVKQGHDIKLWMEIVVLWVSLTDMKPYYYNQITNYDWVDEEHVIKNANRIVKILPIGGEFERPIMYENNKIISGQIDYILDGKINNEIYGSYVSSSYSSSSYSSSNNFDGHGELWEFKCSSELSTDDKLQIGAYLSMYELNNKPIIGKLYNPTTDELLEITVKDPKQFLDILVQKSIQ